MLKLCATQFNQGWITVCKVMNVFHNSTSSYWDFFNFRAWFRHFDPIKLPLEGYLVKIPKITCPTDTSPTTIIPKVHYPDKSLSRQVIIPKNNIPTSHYPDEKNVPILHNNFNSKCSMTYPKCSRTTMDFVELHTIFLCNCCNFLF